MYLGNCYKVPLTGSWNANPDQDLVGQDQMIDCNNINLHNGGREPRGGCELVNTRYAIGYNIAIAEFNSWNSICYGNGLYVAIASDGTHRIMTSPDGITWTYRTAAEANSWISVCYGNGLFVAVATGGTHRVMTSLDGITWTYRTAAAANPWISVCYGNGTFVAVATMGTYEVMTSTDGITWATQTAAENNPWSSVCYGNGLFVAVSVSGTHQVMTSPTGTTWTVQTAAEGNQWYSVCYGNSLYVAVANNGTHRIMTSSNGTAWTYHTAPEPNSWYSVCYGNGLYVAVAYTGTNRIMTSADGLIWTVRTDIDANSWQGVCYGNEQFIAVASSGINAIYVLGLFSISGLYQFLREDGVIQGSYIVDENGDNIGDEYGNKLVSEGSDTLLGLSNGLILKNYITTIKSPLTAVEEYFFEAFYNELYISNGRDWPQVWGMGEDYTWDIGTPKRCTATLAGTGAGNVNAGTHYYKITFVTPSGESSGGAISLVVTTTAGDGKVNLTDIQVGLSACTARKIYRTNAGGSAFYLIGTISDNTTTTFADNVADDTVTAIPTTNLAFCPSDWQTDPPKYFVKHGRGLNSRLWAFGCETHPNVLYASLSGEADFSDANVITIQIMSSKLTGLVEFGARLIAFDLKRAYIVNDEPLNILNWGYWPSQWEGGCADQKLIAKTPTDLVVVDESGEIYSITASQQYGDYQMASLSRPFYIHTWLKNNADMGLMNRWHMQYDQKLRMLKLFVTLKGSSIPNTCLGFFIDRKMWTKHSFAMNMTCSAPIRISDYDWKIYTGSDSGKVYSLESDILRDDGVIYESGFTTPPLGFDNPRSTKRFDKLWLISKSFGTEEFNFYATVDNRAITNPYTITMTQAKDDLVNKSAFLGFTGNRTKFEFLNDDGNPYFLSQLMVDSVELGSI